MRSGTMWLALTMPGLAWGGAPTRALDQLTVPEVMRGTHHYGIYVGDEGAFVGETTLTVTVEGATTRVVSEMVMPRRFTSSTECTLGRGMVVEHCLVFMGAASGARYSVQRKGKRWVVDRIGGDGVVSGRGELRGEVPLRSVDPDGVTIAAMVHGGVATAAIGRTDYRFGALQSVTPVLAATDPSGVVHVEIGPNHYAVGPDGMLLSYAVEAATLYRFVRCDGSCPTDGPPDLGVTSDAVGEGAAPGLSARSGPRTPVRALAVPPSMVGSLRYGLYTGWHADKVGELTLEVDVEDAGAHAVQTTTWTGRADRVAACTWDRWLQVESCALDGVRQAGTRETVVRTGEAWTIRRERRNDLEVTPTTPLRAAGIELPVVAAAVSAGGDLDDVGFYVDGEPYVRPLDILVRKALPEGGVYLASVDRGWTLGADGAVVSAWMFDWNRRVKIVRCEGPCPASLDRPSTDLPDIRRALTALLGAMDGVVTLDDLAAHVDLEHPRGGAVGAAAAEAFTHLCGRPLTRSPDPEAEAEAEATAALVPVTVQGDLATAHLEGREAPVLLHRVGERWLFDATTLPAL